MLAFAILGFSAFFLCLVFTPLCRDLFLKAGLVDMPDLDRKFHLRAVPRMGGVPIVISYAAAIGLVLCFNPGGTRLYVQHQVLFRALLPATSVIFATGLLDDLFGLKPWQKLIGQFAGASLAIALGARLSLHHVPSWACLVLSFIWLIGCTNAVNLIDGMDGLATGVGLLATLSTLLVALLSGNVGLALATVPLLGCLLAFLRYNFSPASVFLGDCGSLTIGFVLGCFGLAWSQHTGTLLGILAPLTAFSLPLIDVLLAIGRRLLRAVPIFQGDRGHIHHRVLALGFSTRGAALVLYAVCAFSAMLAVLESLSYRLMIVPIVLIFLILVLVGIHRLGYVEFSAARKALSHTSMLGAVHDNIYLEELALSLQDVQSVDQWWGILRNTCQELSFASVDVELDGQTFRERLLTSSREVSCRIHIDLADRGTLALTLLEGTAPPRIMMAVLEKFSSVLQDPRVIASAAMVSSNAA